MHRGSAAAHRRSFPPARSSQAAAKRKKSDRAERSCQHLLSCDICAPCCFPALELSRHFRVMSQLEFRLATPSGHAIAPGLKSCRENCFPDSKVTNFSERKLNPSPSATFRRSSGGISRIMEPNSFNVTNWEGETLAAPSFGNCKRAAKTPLARAY